MVAVLTVVLTTVLAVLATVRRRGVIATTDAVPVPVLVKRMKSVAAVLQMRMRCNVRQCAAQRVQKVAGQALLGDRRAAVRVAQRVRRVGQVSDQVRWTLVVRSVRSALVLERKAAERAVQSVALQWRCDHADRHQPAIGQAVSSAKRAVFCFVEF